MHGMSSQAKAVFLWGTKEEVLSRSRADVPAFRLCRAGGELPPVELPFLAPGAEVMRTIVRGGRVVASVYEDEDAQYLLAAGVCRQTWRRRGALRRRPSSMSWRPCWPRRT